MNIPDDLKFFSLIYEYRAWITAPLLGLWIFGTFYFLFRLKKVFFLWLLILPFFIQPLNIAATWSGWHYRMELRNRFAKADKGWSDEYTDTRININLMPEKIRAEYAKHNYHPRFRDIKVMLAGTIILLPLLYVLGSLLFITVMFIEKKFTKKKKSS